MRVSKASQAPRAVVTMETADGRELHLNIELATTPTAMVVGLRNRDSIPENGGMLFVFPDEGRRSFWMKDVRIPLDIIFIAANGHVVGIVLNAKPHATEFLRHAGAKYVLEVRGGWTRRNGVGKGSRLRVGDFDPDDT